MVNQHPSEARDSMHEESAPLLSEHHESAQSSQNRSFRIWNSSLWQSGKRLALTTIAICIFMLTMFVFGGGLWWKNHRGAGMSDSEWLKQLPKRVCTSRECVLFAADLMNMLDDDTDPCLDFHQYSCGGLVKFKQHPAHLSNADRIKDETIFELKSLLSPSLAPEEPVRSSDLHSQNLNTLKSLFQKCVDAPVTNPDLINFLSSYTSTSSFPIGKSEFPSSHRNILSQNFTTAMLNAHLLGNYNPMFTWDIVPESRPRGNRTYLMRVSRSELMMDENQYYNATAVYELVSKIADALESLEFQNVALVGRLVARDGFYRSAQNIVKIEKRLVETCVGAFEMSRNNAVVDVKDLQNIFPSLDWNRYLEGLVRGSYNRKVVVHGVMYFDSWAKLIQEEGADSIELFLVWKLGIQYLSLMKEKNALSPASARWQLCIEEINQRLPDVLGSFFLRTRSSHWNESTSTIYSKVSREMQSRVLTGDGFMWMENNTKLEAIDKLKAINSHFGYTDDLLSPDYIFSRLMPVKQAVSRALNLLDIFQAIRRNDVKNAIAILSETANPHLWPMKSLSPLSIYPQFVANLNSLFVPLAITSKKLLPKYIDYGIVGSQIGEHALQSILDPGRLYTTSGTHKSWYTLMDVRNYHAMLEQVGTAINSTNLSEALDTFAWNSALQMAVTSWEQETISLLKENRFIEAANMGTRLVGLEDWTWQKVIYVVGAQQKCAIGNESTRRKVNYLQNSEGFQNTFCGNKLGLMN